MLCRSGIVSTVPVEIQNRKILAVLDTSAEVTVLSDRLLKELHPQPSLIRKVTLKSAGRGLKMEGRVVGPINIKIGKNLYNEEIYVAPIEDDMLLGLKFLRKIGASADLANDILTIKDEKIPMQFGNTNDRGLTRIARVRIAKEVVIPPLTVAKVPCHLSRKLHDFIIEPSVNRIPDTIIMPRTFHNGGSATHACMINLSNDEIKLLPEKVIAVASEALETTSRNINNQESSHNTPIINKVEIDHVPEHLQDMINRSASKLNENEVKKLTDLLIEYQDVFAKDEFDLGNFTEIEHRIDTKDAAPVKLRMRRTPACFVDEEKEHLDKMLKAGVIQPSMSEWAAAPVLVRKKCGGVRWCIDWRKLNEVTTKDQFPLPLIDECLDTLSGSKWFSKLDANSAYWQVRIAEEDQHKTAFITKYGLFEFARLGFGLTGAPATFSRVMNLVLHGLTWDIALAFLDDIMVMGTDFDNHLSNLRSILDRFRKYGLKLKPKKCEFFKDKVEFLGHIVSQNKLEVGSEYIDALTNWKIPTTTVEVERFLGFVNYHRNFIKDLAEIAKPLYGLTGKNKFHWLEQHQAAFEKLRTALSTEPVLTIPNTSGEFILDCDASQFAIGGELSQIQDGQERVIGYCSFAMTSEQQRYCTTRKELLAIIRCTRQFKHYLLGRRFTVRTDHNSLIWLCRFKEPQGQLARWIEELSQYNMILQHRPGLKHVNADALSRSENGLPCSDFRTDIAVTELPCHGCKFCRKAHADWYKFSQEVDNVENLSSAAPLFSQGCTYASNTNSGLNVTRTSLVTPIIAKISEEGWYESDNGSEDIFQTEILIAASPHTAVIGTMKPETKDVYIFSGYSEQDLKRYQEMDPNLKMILAWMRTGKVPKEADLFKCNPAQKNMWINKEIFVLKNGVLRMMVPEETDRTLLVVPSSLRNEILELCHDIPAAGHQGIDRTIARMKKQFYWYGMSQDVKRYVSTCRTCSTQKKRSKKGKYPLTLYHAGAPMERIHIDFLGPLSKSINGNEYILVMVDQFTKWVEIVPLQSQNAEITAKAVIDNFLSKFGYPFQIHSDQGRNFESKLFHSVCELLKIHKSRTTPYRPQANGQVERYNRTLMEAIRCFTDNRPNDWDKYLQQLAGALRSSVNRHTGFTPNMLMLGREINQPVDLMFRTPTEHEKYSLCS